jgi:hypothetical protein
MGGKNETRRTASGKKAAATRARNAGQRRRTRSTSWQGKRHRRPVEDDHAAIPERAAAPIEAASFRIDQMSQWNSKEETDAGSSAYPAEKARQGEIILRKPWQRIVFIVGLLAPLVFFLIGWLLAWKWA